MLSNPITTMITNGAPAITKTTSRDATALTLTPSAGCGSCTAQASRQTLTCGWVSMIACPAVRSKEMVHRFFGTK